MFNRYSFPIDDQTLLVFLDPSDHIEYENIDVVVDLLNDLYGINHFAAVVFILNGTHIEENLDSNELACDLLEMPEELRKCQDFFKQVSFVSTNCSPHALNFNCPTFNILDNVNIYFMQNSVYQLFRARSATDSVETDFCRSIETMGQIIKKIVDKIHHQA